MTQLIVTLEGNAPVEDIKEAIQMFRGVGSVISYKNEASGNE